MHTQTSNIFTLSKAHHKITPAGKSGYGIGLGSSPKFWGFACNISATAKASNFKINVRLGFAKARHKIPHRRKSGCGPGLEELLNILGFPFNICATAEARNFKFGMQLGFVKAHQKTTPRGQSGHGLGLPNICGSPLVFLQRPVCPVSVSGASC